MILHFQRCSFVLNENHQLLGLLQRMCSNFLITYKVFVDVLSVEITNLLTSPSRVPIVVILNEKSPSCFIPQKSYNMTRVSHSTRDSAYSAQTRTETRIRNEASYRVKFSPAFLLARIQISRYDRNVWNA